MTEKYLSVAKDTQTEKIIEKSRFITTSRRVASEEKAKEFIASISEKYSDATHNCYAYISDRLGNLQRFSDDGEPQGTAGMPILEVIKSKSLKEVAVVVTRYFGGIKLGAGGLVRAYSGCAAENLDRAQKVLFEPCTELEVTLGYPLADSANRLFESYGADIIDAEYLNEVKFTVAVKTVVKENIIFALNNRFGGTVKCKELRESFRPLKI